MSLGISPTTFGLAEFVPIVVVVDVMSMGDPVLKFRMPPNCHCPTICCSQPGALARKARPVPNGNSYVPLLVIWNLRSTPCKVLYMPRRFGSTVSPVSNALLHTQVVVLVKPFDMRRVSCTFKAW